MEAYRLAVALSPNVPEANSRLGHILMARGRVTEASQAFRAAAAVNSDSTERRMDLTRALIILGKDRDAETELRRVLERDPKSNDAYWLLGRILTESGRFADARAAFEQALAIDANQGAVYYDLVRAFTVTEADRPLIQRMLALTRTPKPADDDIRLHLGLGKTFDDLKQYDLAINHFNEANRIKYSQAPFDRNAFARRIDNLIQRFTPEFLATHVRQGSDSQLPVMILGMPRSGTTLVEQIVSAHRDVAGAGELQFWVGRGPPFNSLIDATSTSKFLQQVAHDYLKILHEYAPEAKRVTDKTPFNFLWVGLIHLAFPRATIIHCRRHPIDTCISVLSTYFRNRSDFTTDRDDLVFYYRQYVRLMAHWKSILPIESFVEVDYETLIASPEPVCRQLIAACGLTWEPACLRPELNQRVVRTASKWQARQPINNASVERWRRYEPWLGNLRELLSP